MGSARDADAECVAISLPGPMSDIPIAISDDGSGMSTKKLNNYYLSIASDRRARRGACTARNQVSQRSQR